MAVVEFNPVAFKESFPEFADVPDARCTTMFNIACAGLLDNTDASVVTDVDQRTSLLYLLVAHLLSLFGTTASGAGGNGGPRGVVGRVASATEGTVSTSLEFRVPESPGAAWYTQTQYGAMYWMMLAPFRSFRYVPVGRSGVGTSVDFLSADRARYNTGGGYDW